MSAEGPSTGVPSDEPDAFDLDDDLEEFLEAWDNADRAAATLLRDALTDFRGKPPPVQECAAIASRLRDGLVQAIPESDIELVLSCTAATISPREETDLDPEEEATLFALEHADWLGAIVSAVRQGPGSDASPESLAGGIRACPEVELPPDVDLEEDTLTETAFWILALPWHVLGLTDGDQRLTLLGAWILPRALGRAWGFDFDGRSQG
jgi:hypothetical protein